MKLISITKISGGHEYEFKGTNDFGVARALISIYNGGIKIVTDGFLTVADYLECQRQIIELGGEKYGFIEF